MLSKIRDTTRADNDEIGANLMRLANTRPDIFGSTEEEFSQVSEGGQGGGRVSEGGGIHGEGGVSHLVPRCPLYPPPQP